MPERTLGLSEVDMVTIHLVTYKESGGRPPSIYAVFGRGNDAHREMKSLAAQHPRVEFSIVTMKAELLEENRRMRSSYMRSRPLGVDEQEYDEDGNPRSLSHRRVRFHFNGREQDTTAWGNW